MEVWKKVKGFNTYEVSDRHRVRNEHGIVLTIWVDKAGRHHVAMKKDGAIHHRYIVELVEEAFTPEQEAFTPEQEAEQAQETAEQGEADIVPTPKKKPAKTAKKTQE